MALRPCLFIGGPLDGQVRAVADREYVQTAPDDSEHGLSYYERWRAPGSRGLFVLKGLPQSTVNERLAQFSQLS